MRYHPASLPGLWPVIAGFTLWAVAFIALYAAISIGCRMGWDSAQVLGLSLHRLLLIGLYAGFCAALLGLAWAQWQTMRRAAASQAPLPFITSVGMAASVAAGAATLLMFAPVLVLDTCL